MADGWCPENDGAYRAEMAALHRDNVDQQLLRARAEIERLRAALAFYTVSDNWCIGGPLDGNSPSCTGGPARAALAQKGDQP